MTTQPQPLSPKLSESWTPDPSILQEKGRFGTRSKHWQLKYLVLYKEVLERMEESLCELMTLRASTCRTNLLYKIYTNVDLIWKSTKDSVYFELSEKMSRRGFPIYRLMYDGMLIGFVEGAN